MTSTPLPAKTSSKIVLAELQKEKRERRTRIKMRKDETRKDEMGLKMIRIRSYSIAEKNEKHTGSSFRNLNIMRREKNDR